MDATRRVLDGLGFDAEYIHGDIGWEFWKSEGNPLPDRTLEMMRGTNCALFGAITSKPKEEAASELDPSLRDKGYVYFSPIVRLRQEFTLHTNLRPCRAFPGNPLNYRDNIDLVVFRENTEGLYAGVEFHPVPDTLRKALEDHHKKMAVFQKTSGEDLAISCRIFTRHACQRIVRQAFKYAKENGYKSVTVVEKPNVIRETSGLMVREARKVAQEFPGVELWEANVDAMAMWLIKNPEDYGVLVASNMFGDIISDLCAQLVGGLGFAASGNIGDEFAVFEPTHGSAPKYAGQDKVNPTAMILSARLMLNWLGEKDMARKVEAGIAKVLKEGKVRTYDLGGNSTTTQMADAILEAARAS
jgi:3-isopropylmalate dehydrogenase